MNQKQISNAKELLTKAYSVLPSDFSLREVRAYIYNALQKIALFETRQAKKQEQNKQEQEKAEAKRKSQMEIKLPWQNNDIIQAISVIDKMIAEEESKINGYKQKQQSVQPEDNDKDSQTFYG